MQDRLNLREQASEAREPRSGRAGRPRTTTARRIRLEAIRLFVEQGYAATSVDDIASAARIGRTTFFRYFPTKSSVVWSDLEENRRRLTIALADEARPDEPVLAFLRRAVLAAVVYDDADRAFVRARGGLLAGVPELGAEGAAATERWASAIAEGVTRRSSAGGPALAAAIGFALMGATGATLQLWSTTEGDPLTDMLRTALDAIAAPLQTALDQAR